MQADRINTTGEFPDYKVISQNIIYFFAFNLSREKPNIVQRISTDTKILNANWCNLMFL